MIIVSQDKSEIVNFDEAFRLYADNWSDEDFPTEPNCFCIRAEKSGDHMTSAFLGEYATMKRAKEVLFEIATHNATFNLFKCSDTEKQKRTLEEFLKKGMMFDIYEMPEK